MAHIRSDGMLVTEIQNPNVIDWFCSYQNNQYTIHELDPVQNLLIYRPINGKKPEEYLNLS